VEKVLVEKDGEEIAQIYGISFYNREIKTRANLKERGLTRYKIIFQNSEIKIAAGNIFRI